MLNSRENFFRMMCRDRDRGPERLPFDLPATPPVLDWIERERGTRDVVQAFGSDFYDCSPRLAGDPVRWRAAYEELGVKFPENAEIEANGFAFALPTGGSTGEAYHFREMLHPLSEVEEVAQLEQLPWPDLNDPEAADGVEERIGDIRQAGKISVAPLECTVFESAWYVRGMDNLFGDLIEGNPVGDWLLDWFTERSICKARIAARAGIDIVALGDDVGTQRGMMMSVDFWREHLRPRLQRVIDSVRAAQQRHVYIRYHSDGDIRPIIDDLAEMGVDILNPVQPECMPVAEVVAQHKHHLAFWGMVGTQTTMPFGSTAEVRAAVEECAHFAREGSVVVVAPTHVLEPDVPWENIRAFVDAVRGAEIG